MSDAKDPAWIWIELEKPRDDAHAEESCTKANRMMQRLGDTKGNTFFWDKRRHQYCWGSQMGYLDLTDRGHWFNLDYLGRVEPAYASPL